MSKPKWQQRWKELTGGYKFLEIKGWYQWQEKHYTTDYVRDYYGKDKTLTMEAQKFGCWSAG
jgi:hypothetical protein